MRKPYICVKTGKDETFNATHVMIEPEVYPDGSLYYCVVGIDENKRVKRNLDHSKDLSVAIKKMTDLLIPILLLQKEEKIVDWKRENED